MQHYLTAKIAVKLRGNLIKHHNSQKQRPEVKRARGQKKKKENQINRCLQAVLNRNVAQVFFLNGDKKLAQKVNRWLMNNDSEKRKTFSSASLPSYQPVLLHERKGHWF